MKKRAETGTSSRRPSRFLLTMYASYVKVTTMVVTITERLMELGLSEYESRAWISLLKANPSTAYEVARTSGIPTAKIYPVMDRLVERGMILDLREGERRRYAPCDPEDFLGRFRQKTEETLSSLSRDLSALASTETDVSYVWNVSDYGELMERAGIIVAGSRHAILLSCWGEEYALLADALAERKAAGVDVAVVHFGPVEIPAHSVGAFYEHPIADTLYEERGGRGFALVADGAVALNATIANDDTRPEGGTVRASGAWSRSEGFVLLAEDYIKHDVYIMKIVTRFDRQLVKRFGRGYRRLRDIFSDTEEN